ncbi:hypothetical protein L596_015265 [Steinernema carpocapsae]|uniref:Secreted protein n=1 Tax=Steinernema carpocapsae TaxID=34508 RepID=A0A4U5NEH4_STECR|nr:hypothetical protein L596_015265 [Steinernema carpocapsae]
MQSHQQLLHSLFVFLVWSTTVCVAGQRTRSGFSRRDRARRFSECWRFTTEIWLLFVLKAFSGAKNVMGGLASYDRKTLKIQNTKPPLARSRCKNPDRVLRLVAHKTL